MPTCLEVAGASYPVVSKAGTPPPPPEGKSLVPVFEGNRLPERSLFWEHEGNCAVREGKWKLVSRFPDSWELYDIEKDRTETHDLADLNPDRVRKMAAGYDVWMQHVGAQPWPMPQTPEGHAKGLCLRRPICVTIGHNSLNRPKSNIWAQFGHEPFQ